MKPYFEVEIRCPECKHAKLTRFDDLKSATDHKEHLKAIIKVSSGCCISCYSKRKPTIIIFSGFYEKNLGDNYPVLGNTPSDFEYINKQHNNGCVLCDGMGTIEVSKNAHKRMDLSSSMCEMCPICNGKGYTDE